MVDEVTPELDPGCPSANEFLTTLNAELNASGLTGEKHAMASIAAFERFANQHISSCSRCLAHARKAEGGRVSGIVGDNRSAIWGGATLGLLVGLIVGFFRQGYWQTVAIAVVIGAALGAGAEVLARIGGVARRKTK
jgi:hypothetical protein